MTPAELYYQYRGLVSRAVRRFNLPQHMRLPLWDDAMTELLRLAQKYDPARGVPFPSYAGASLARFCMRHIRRHNVSRREYLTHRAADVARACADRRPDADGSGLLAADLETAIAQLSSEQRAAFDGWTDAGFRVEGYAAAAGISRASAFARVADVRAALRRNLDAYRLPGDGRLRSTKEARRARALRAAGRKPRRPLVGSGGTAAPRREK